MVAEEKASVSPSRRRFGGQSHNKTQSLRLLELALYFIDLPPGAFPEHSRWALRVGKTGIGLDLDSQLPPRWPAAQPGFGHPLGVK